MSYILMRSATKLILNSEEIQINYDIFLHFNFNFNFNFNLLFFLINSIFEYFVVVYGNCSELHYSYALK